MANENGVWIMHGVKPTDKKCLHSVAELEACVKEMGFLPLFANEIKGFSLEERTTARSWWSGDIEHDPWLWRTLAGQSGEITYGKFFNKKTGFISKEWFPCFANYRRDGYDFDALWGDELASHRQKKIMDLFAAGQEYCSPELKRRAGFGRGGEKNFEGTITGLQTQAYLCISGFHRRQNKEGEEYGWHIAAYSMPESLWGYDYIAAAYEEAPARSWQRIREHIRRLFPRADERAIMKVMGIKKINC